MLRQRVILLGSVLALAVALAAPAAAASAAPGRASASPAPRPVSTKTATATSSSAAAAARRTLAQRLLAAGHTAPAVTGPETVVLALTPRNFALLAATAAAAKTLAPAVRNARREAAIAGPARAGLVAVAARRLGLTVLSTSDMAVTVQGSSALIHQEFGSARDTDPTALVAQALPRIPASLAAYVTEAGGGDETRPAELPMVSADSNPAPLTVSQLRTMYNVPADSAPPDDASPTIATLQFSGWDDSDLQTYIDGNDDRIYGANTPEYDLSTDFTSEDVLPDSGGLGTDGSSEVALDQETLASVAPQLRQRAYEAPDDNPDGEYAELNTVAQQAAADHIVAVSTSWGLCEPENYREWFANESDPILTADETAVYNVLAAGVTMFAASGDSGATDCDYTQSDGSCASGPAVNGAPAPSSSADYVDTPASIPGVIAVGGTSGTDVTDLASWDDAACSASGGGFSCMFLRPSYQQGTDNVPAAPYGTNYACPETNSGVAVSARGVPDISADAGDGLNVYDSDSEDCSPCQLIGTSFAVQIAAGAWAQTLVDHGAITKGAGDIDAALYSGPLKSSIHDVVHGADLPNIDYQYRTTAGWDPVTGLGSPNFNAMVTAIAGNADRAADIYFVQRSGTGSGNVEVSGLAEADSFHGFSNNQTTPLTITDPSEWEFAVGPYDKDGREDLYAIQTSGTTSGKVQVSVIAQNSNYTQFALQNQPTGLAEVAAGQYQFRVAAYAGDGQSDLFAIRDSGASNTQVFAFSAASKYSQLIVARDTPLGPEPAWTFLIGNHGDLVAVNGTGSAVAVFVLPSATSYHAFTSKVLTPLKGGSNPAVSYTLGDVNADGTPDITQVSTGGSETEIFTVSGASSFHTYLEARITPLGTLNPDDWSAAQQS